MEMTLRDLSIEFIKLNPGSTVSDVAQEIRKNRPVKNDSIHVTLRSLTNDGYIDRSKIEGVVRYFYRGPKPRFGEDHRLSLFDKLKSSVRHIS